MHHHPISTSAHNSEDEALLPEDNSQQPSVRSSRSFSRWVAHPFWYVCHPSTDATGALTYVSRQADPRRPRVLYVRKSCLHQHKCNTPAYAVCSAVSQCHQESKSTGPLRAGHSHSLTTQSASLPHQTAKALMCRPGRQKYRQVGTLLVSWPWHNVNPINPVPYQLLSPS